MRTVRTLENPLENLRYGRLESLRYDQAKTELDAALLESPGCRLRFDFSTCKLLDLVADEAALKASREPAAIVVLANWAVQQAGKDNRRKFALKWDLTRRLYEIGLAKTD